MTQGPQNKSRFVGKLMQAWFRTATNLEELMPPALEIVGDPHRAFVKVYDLKTRRVGAPIARPGHNQYRQVCGLVSAQ